MNTRFEIPNAYRNFYLKAIQTSIFVLTVIRFAGAQNLIPDSSFEANRFVPLEFSAIGASRSWSKPSLGTSDLFCKCSRKQKKYSLVNVPNNPMGNQYPHSGTCYAGFFAFSHGLYREYVQSPLTKPLEKNKLYRFKMYISLSDYSRAAIDQLGFCFFNAKANFKSTSVLSQLNPVYLKIADSLRKDTTAWQCLKGIYLANGEENYIVIGSFNINEIQKTKVKAPKAVRSRINQISERDAYYYIDDVSVFEIADSSVSPEIDSVLSVKQKLVLSVPLTFPIVLKHILFEVNEAVLLANSLPELENMLEYLKKNEAVYIEISGHTDSSGNEERNQVLSERRARSVSDFFVEHGIAKNRVSYKGFGSSMPIATNTKEEGKRQNRRVEFVLKNK